MTFEELYEAQVRRVFNLVLNHVQNEEDAQEITQDVFVAVYQHMGRFRQDAKASTWIYRIAINKSLDFLRAKRRKKRFAAWLPLLSAEAQESGSFAHPGVSLEQQEAVAQIFSMINTLPEKQKTALILTKLQHLSQEEAAAVMGISNKALESLVQRAKRQLAQKMQRSKG